MLEQLEVVEFLRAEAELHHKRGDRRAYWEYRRLFLLAQSALREQLVGRRAPNDPAHGRECVVR